MKAGSMLGGVCLLLTGALAAEANATRSDEAPVDDAQAAAREFRLETLMTRTLAGATDTEVIVSRVQLAPHSQLQKHWHPGEEFAYVISGRVTLWLGEDAPVTGHAGEVLQVPYKQVHWASTGEEGATLLIFRVHEAGQPERVLTD